MDDLISPQHTQMMRHIDNFGPQDFGDFGNIQWAITQTFDNFQPIRVSNRFEQCNGFRRLAFS